MTARWMEGETLVLDCADVGRVLREAAASDSQPVIVEFESEGARINVVSGDQSGTVILWWPPGYAEIGLGSLHSVGRPEVLAIDSLADCDRDEGGLTAFYLTHHTEFPHWMVVPSEQAEIAAKEFCDSPATPPPSVLWEKD